MPHPLGVKVLLIAMLAGGVAAASPVARAPAAKAPPAKAGVAALPPMWIGVFDPKLPVHPPWGGNAKLTPVAHGGVVRVLTPESGPAAAGDVVIVHPLLGKIASGKVDKGTVALADFAFDQRDGDDGVIVLPGGTAVALVAPSKPDSAAIAALIVKTDAIAGVRRALAGIEVAGVDVNGDGKADIVTTYGCTAWFDGSCQSRGQFVLVRRGARWAIVE
jgi:hypothetical protein